MGGSRIQVGPSPFPVTIKCPAEFARSMVRTWCFFLPGSGEHVLKVEKLGTKHQKVLLDGAKLESREGQTVFSGPGDAILRFKHTPDQKRRWVLLVDEHPVEEAGKSGAGLRDLRNMAEGSYTIATGFSASGVIRRKSVCRRFRFRIAGQLHTVIVANEDRTWQVAFDDDLIDQEKYSILDTAVEVEFVISCPDGSSLPARLEIVWNMMALTWTHCLHIGGIRVPACWNKTRGLLRKQAPEVFPGWLTVSSNSQIDVAEEDAVEEEDEDEDEISTELEDSGKEDVALDALPQGVSYDQESGAFQANIRDSKTGRFIFLGEFTTPERAHKTYLEALPRYNPGKAIAPTLA